MLSIRAATIAAGAAVVALGVLGPVSSRAHVVSEPDEGAAGSYMRAAFRVSHGCKGSPTISVTIRMPDGVVQAKPQVKPGWTIEIKTRPLDPPIDSGHGFKIRNGVTEVTWRGGRLENAHFDEFVLLLRLPAKAGETLYFPTLQTCENGKQDWSAIPSKEQKWSDLPEPAPFINVKEAGHAHH